MSSPSLETLVRVRENQARAARAKQPWVTGEKQESVPVTSVNRFSLASNRATSSAQIRDGQSQSDASFVRSVSSQEGVVRQSVRVETLGAGVVNVLGDAVAVMVDGTYASGKAGLMRFFYGAGQVVRGTTGVVVGVLGCLGCMVVCIGKTVIGSSQQQSSQKQ